MQTDRLEIGLRAFIKEVYHESFWITRNLNGDLENRASSALRFSGLKNEWVKNGLSLVSRVKWQPEKQQP